MRARMHARPENDCTAAEGAPGCCAIGRASSPGLTRVAAQLGVSGGCSSGWPAHGSDLETNSIVTRFLDKESSDQAETSEIVAGEYRRPEMRFAWWSSMPGCWFAPDGAVGNTGI